MSNDILKNLAAKRANAWEQMKAHVEECEKRGEWSEEDNTKYERMNSDLDTLDSRINDIVEAEKRAERIPSDLEEKEEQRKAPEPSAQEKFEAEMRSFLLNPDRRSGPGLDYRQTEIRDLSSGTAPAGGNTIPTSFVKSLYVHMAEHSAVRAAGAKVFVTSSGEALEFPKTTAHGSAALVAEAAAIAESDPTFGKMTLNAYKYGVLIQVPFELAQDTGVDLLGYIAEQAGWAVGDASGAHFITGDGSSKPNGVATAAGTGTTGATGQTTSVTADDLIDLHYSVTSPYRKNAAWLMRDASVAKIRKLKDADNQYLWQPGLQAGEPDRILGKPVHTDPNVAAMAASAKSILFGDFSKYYIRDVGQVRFERSDDYAFANDLITFRCLIRTDGDLIDSNAVKAYVNSAT